jgi:hypothetical protein
MSPDDRPILSLLLVFCLISASGCIMASPDKQPRAGWITPVITVAPYGPGPSTGGAGRNQSEMRAVLFQIGHNVNRSLHGPFDRTSPPVRPELIFAEAISPVVNGTGYEVTVIGKDGRIVYDRDPGQTGKNVFSDPVFSDENDLKRFAGEVVTGNASGQGDYTTHDPVSGQSVNVNNSWITVTSDDTPWFIIVSRVVT